MEEEGFHLKEKKKKKRGVVKRRVWRRGWKHPFFFQGEDAVAAVLGTTHQVIRGDDSVLGKLNCLFIKSMDLGRW